MKIPFKTSFFILSIILNSLVLPAQQSVKSFNKELIVVSENDNYNLYQNDRYYTNGIFIKYNWLAKKENKPLVFKTINRTEAGQMMYNPYFNSYTIATVLETMDRPYAAWLYGSYGKTKIFNNDDVLMYDGILGIMGPSALGQEAQSLSHSFSGLYSLVGWEYQVQDEIGINASVKYYRSLKTRKPHQNLTLHAVGKAMIGNTFTNASAGFLLKTGFLEKEGNSAYWTGIKNSSAEKTKHITEAIFFLEPSLMFQAYNATVQGGMFRSNKGLYVSPLNPFVYLVKAGGLISRERASLSIDYTLKHREAKSMIDNIEIYGAIGVSYRFR